jgi:hypothetical protein
VSSRCGLLRKSVVIESAVWLRLVAIRPRIPDLQIRLEAASAVGGQEAVDDLIALLLLDE